MVGLSTFAKGQGDFDEERQRLKPNGAFRAGSVDHSYRGETLPSYRLGPTRQGRGDMRLGLWTLLIAARGIAGVTILDDDYDSCSVCRVTTSFTAPETFVV